MSLLLALIGFALLAIVAILDKFILTKTIHQPAVFVFYSTVFILPILFAVPFGVSFQLTPADWLLALVSGGAFAAALYAMYVGFQISEVSHAGPLVGAGTAFFVSLFSQIFLAEALSVKEWCGIGLLIIGCVCISFEQSRRNNGWHRGMLWAVAAGLLFAISHVSAKYLYDVHGFYSGFVWTRAAIGVCGLFLLFNRSVYHTIALFSYSAAPKRRSPASSASTRQVALVIASKVMAILAIVIIQYATAIGSVTVVNALHGAQYALLVIMVALLSKFHPALFSEQYQGRELVREILAVLIIAVGLGFLI